MKLLHVFALVFLKYEI